MFRANHQISLVFQRAARRSRYVFLALRAVRRGLGLHVWSQSSSLMGIFNGLLGLSSELAYFGYLPKRPRLTHPIVRQGRRRLETYLDHEYREICLVILG